MEETFAGYPLTLAQAACPLDELRRRNIARGDRTPEQCAQALLDALRQRENTEK